MSTLLGCGGSDTAAKRLHSLRNAWCEVNGIEHELRALAAGIAATRRELDAPSPGPQGRRTLHAMKENVGAIHSQLPALKECPSDALGASEGKAEAEAESEPEVARPRLPTVVAHRIGPPVVEPGGPPISSLPCSFVDQNGRVKITIFGDGGGCVKGRPGDRLSFSYSAEAGPAPVRVAIGGSEMWLKPGQTGVIPGPLGNYLAAGSHSARVAGSAGAGTLIIAP